jgi:hypothetical protein
MLIAQIYLVPLAVAEQQNYVEQLIQKAADDELADTRGWRALLHYKPAMFTGWESQADDEAFFIANDGKTNPEAELIATIEALAAPVIDADNHPQCLFPARYHWLKEQLTIDSYQLEPVVCPEMTRWFEELKPKTLTLIFPSAYINSPSSMFGHTLLRVNPGDFRAGSPMVSYALNYAADADATDNSLVFSIKGLIGGYPGIFSIVPYYEKIREYSDLENRDVWEYSLNFSEDEVHQLMRHAWEVKDITFDYYFLTENCSYHMLSLMEAARPELSLTDPFDIKAIPADTVRAVTEAGLVTETVYRPSSTSILKHRARQISADDNDTVIKIADSEVTVDEVSASDRSALDKARIYEQAYDYSRFLSTADPSVRDVRSKTNWKLLSARSKIDRTNIWTPVPVPEVKSEDGHSTTRFAAGVGELDDESYISLKFRPAYHDVVDKVAGYSKGAQINFLDINIRYYNEQEKLRLDKFTIINVLSLTPIDKYFSPISWGVDFAIERQPTRREQADAAQLVVNFGGSVSVYDYITLSLLGEANAKVANEYDKGYSAGLGVKFSALVQEDDYSFFSTLSSVAFEAGEENTHQKFDINVAYHMTFNDSVRITYERIRDYDAYRSDMLIAYHRYF